jgi:hypothetical protein
MGRSSFQVRAEQVIAQWGKSPVKKAWRTGIVLLSPDQILAVGNDMGFTSQRQKGALGAGDLRLSGHLPSTKLHGKVRFSDGSTRAVQLLSADQAFRKLATNSPCGAPDGKCGQLTVTGARPATITLDTNRGTATAPAWQFKLAGFGWFTYAALAPGTYSSLPPVPDYPLPYWSSGASVAAVSADGRTLTLQFGTSACVSGSGGLVYETSAAVVVGSWSKVSGTGCNLALVFREAMVHLAQPLGSRVILDAGKALPVAPG